MISKKEKEEGGGRWGEIIVPWKIFLNMLFSYFLSEILLSIVTLFTTEELDIQGFALPLYKLLNLAISFTDGKHKRLTTPNLFLFLF